MALDSRNKRAAALGLALAFLSVPPVPDGAVTAADRAQIGGFYFYEVVPAGSPSYRYLIDWDNDGFICRDARPGDALNQIPTPLTWGELRIAPFRVGASVEIQSETSADGLLVLRVETGTATDGGAQFGSESGMIDDIAVAPGTTYSAAVSVRGISGYAGVDMLLIAIDEDFNGWASDTFTLTADWQRVTISGTTNVGSSFTNLLILKNGGAADVTFEARGFLLVEGASVPDHFNAGLASNLYDDVSAWVQQADWSLGFKKAWQRVADDVSARLVLRNDTKLFSPDYSASPLHDSLLPQRTLQIESVWGSVTRRHFTGWIDAVAPTFGSTRGPFQCTISARGLLPNLKAAELHLPLLEDVTAAEILEAVLAQTILPPGAVGGRGWVLEVAGHGELEESTYPVDTDAIFEFDDGLNTYPYVGDNWEGQEGAAGPRDRFASAYDAIVSVVEAERGKVFVNRDGKLVFWDRTHFQADTTVQATITNPHGLSYAMAADTVVNRVRLKVYPRKEEEDAILWRLDEPIIIHSSTSADGPNEQEFRARWAQADGQQVGAKDVVAPNTGDGSLAVSQGNLTIVAFEPDARGARIVLRNESTWNSAHLDALILKGTKITAWNAQEVEAVDPASAALYGLKEMAIDARLLGDFSLAQDIADYELALRKDPRGVADKLTLMNKDATYLTQILARTIGDRISVSEAQTAHAGEYFIVGEQHRVRDNGRVHTCDWMLEPAGPYTGWLLEVEGRGELEEATLLGY